MHFVLNSFPTPPENRVVKEIMWKDIAESDKPHACALHAGYLRLQTHTRNM